MAIACKKICESFRGKSIPNKVRYAKGQKRCTFCAIFIEHNGQRCPCCGCSLRTRSRNQTTI